MLHEVYLQGSYPNSTNIRGDSDVDVVIESPSTFYSDVPNHRRAEYGLTLPAVYEWPEFRNQVLQALRNYYGYALVTEGDKCIKVAGRGDRLNADVVPCCPYRQYTSVATYVEGMTFWTRRGIQIVNFPKLHRRNGSTKNGECNRNYKPAIRMFKNARNKAESDFPSYFLEGLLYNVPTKYFESSRLRTYAQTLGTLQAARETPGALTMFHCQNGQHKLIGDAPWQTNLFAVQQVIQSLLNLWKLWS